MTSTDSERFVLVEDAVALEILRASEADADGAIEFAIWEKDGNTCTEIQSYSADLDFQVPPGGHGKDYVMGIKRAASSTGDVTFTAERTVV